MRLKIWQFSIVLLFAPCYSTPPDRTACVGSNVNIPWNYPDSANMSSVSWEYIDSSNEVILILLQAAGKLAIVKNDYNIQHNTNGEVTITAVTVTNSGTYRINVAYSSASPTFIDEVVVDVHKNCKSSKKFENTPWKMSITISSLLLLVLIAIGIILGWYLINYRPKGPKDQSNDEENCCCNCKCCKDCVYAYCECCIISGLPYWFFILWFTVIGIPVALGILLMWKCCKKDKHNPAMTAGTSTNSTSVIRYVVITNDGTSSKNDGTWSLGASIGAVCVTGVTPGGPADRKIKVGDHIHTINEEPATETDRNKIKKMLNDKGKLTLGVFEALDGTVETSYVELSNKTGGQLGFKFKHVAMVTGITDGSEVDGKLKAGDTIVCINGIKTKGKSHQEIKTMLELSGGSSISLKIKESGSHTSKDNRISPHNDSGKAHGKSVHGRHGAMENNIEMERRALDSGSSPH